MSRIESRDEKQRQKRATEIFILDRNQNIGIPVRDSPVYPMEKKPQQKWPEG
jgi:hypothetical protein